MVKKRIYSVVGVPPRRTPLPLVFSPQFCQFLCDFLLTRKIFRFHLFIYKVGFQSWYFSESFTIFWNISSQQNIFLNIILDKIRRTKYFGRQNFYFCGQHFRKSAIFSALVSVFPFLLFWRVHSALVVMLSIFLYREMSRRAASQISPRSGSVEERACTMLQRAYNNCSTFVADTIQNMRLRGRLPNTAGASNITHTAFENDLYDDIMNPVQAGRVWSQEHPNTGDDANNNSTNISNDNHKDMNTTTEPIRTLANPAYVSQPMYGGASNPYANISTATATEIAQKPTNEWVQFDDEHVMGPGFADSARLDLQFGDPYNIDPGSAPSRPQASTTTPTYATVGNNGAGDSGYVELPRYNEPSPVGLNIDTNEQQVQYATIPADSSHTDNT